MSFTPILSFAHQLVRDRVLPGDIVVDATMGNGRDTLFLAELVGAGGHVFAFDVQEAALAATRSRLASSGVLDARCTLLLRDHAELLEALPAGTPGIIAAVMFNLGYLPGADHGIMTQPQSTIRALNAALEALRPGGVLSVVVYPGHAGGFEEADAVNSWAAALPMELGQAMTYRFLNPRTPPPYVVAVAKRGK